MHAPYLLFAYFSPETLLPVTSLVAATLGVILMLGKNGFRYVVRCCRRTRGRGAWVQRLQGPHQRPVSRTPHDFAQR